MGSVSDQMTIASVEKFLSVWQVVNIDEGEFITAHVLLL